jgi:hypothetical protein
MVFRVDARFFEGDEISNKQQSVLLQLQKTNRLVLRQLFSSFYVVVTFIIITVIFFLFLGDSIWTIEIIVVILNTFILVLVALNSTRKYWPFWREIDERLRRIKAKSTASDSQNIQDGITSYVNNLQSMLYHSVGIVERSLEEPSERLEKEVDNHLYRSWVIHIVIGSMIVVINHLVIVILFNPQINALLWLYVTYGGVILCYVGMIIQEMKTRKIFKSWTKVFTELDSWAEKLELMPITRDIDQFNINGEI